MEKLNISKFISKSSGDSLTADEWNSVFTLIQDKINEIIGSDTPQQQSKFYVNGTLMTTTGSAVVLTAGNTYTLSGILYGQLIIDATGEAPTSDTTLILDGFTVITDFDNKGILYKTPVDNKGYKELIIHLNQDSENHIVCTKEESRTDDQPGALYSMNNMTIRGVGYLSLYNKGGHGARASELKVSGPHLYVDCIHDGVHAKYLEIDDCTMFCKSANDVYGTGTEGRIISFYNNIYRDNPTSFGGYVFKSGVGGLYLESSSSNFPVTSVNMTSLKDVNENINEDTFKNIFSSLKTPAVTEYPTKDDYVNGTNGNPVRSDGTLYNIGSPYVEVVGLITMPLEIASTITEDINIYLNNAAIIYGSENKACINYLPTSGKVKITGVKDSVNIIYNTYTESGLTPENTECDCIKSENNIKIEVKNGSCIFISSKQGDGIDGGEVKVNDSKGQLVISECGLRGIKGNAVVIGPNANVAKSVITATTGTDDRGYYVDPTDTENYANLEGIVISKHNCQVSKPSIADDSDVKNTGMADIYCRNGKASKGVFGTTDSELKGVLITGTIGAVVNIDMGDALNLYYNECLTSSVDREAMFTEEAYIAVPYNGDRIS